jgi:hypothetical protein
MANTAISDRPQCWQQRPAILPILVGWHFSNEDSHYLRPAVNVRLTDTSAATALAQTLTRIAKGGAREFYEGATAKILATQMEKSRVVIINLKWRGRC